MNRGSLNILAALFSLFSSLVSFSSSDLCSLWKCISRFCSSGTNKERNTLFKYPSFSFLFGEGYVSQNFSLKIYRLKGFTINSVPSPTKKCKKYVE